jgi:glutaredoxin
MTKVTIYTTSNCPPCALLKSRLDRLGQKYDIIDMEKTSTVFKSSPIMAISINGGERIYKPGCPSLETLRQWLKL